MSSKRKRPVKPLNQVEDNPDDAFVAGALQASSWARQNQGLLTVISIALVVLVAGGLYWRSYRASLITQAVEQLESIQQTAGFGDREAAKSELSLYLERFGSTPYAQEARLMLGQLYLESGESDEAVVVLQPSLSDLDNPVSVQAAGLLAAAYEESGRTEEAIEAYLAIAEGSELQFQITEATLDAARLLEGQGDFRGAAALYEDLLSQLDEDDFQRAEIEMRQSEARARANTSATD